MINDPVILLLTDVFSRAGIYSGFIALCVMVINIIVGAFSGRGLKIE